MSKIAIYTLTSELHDKNMVTAETCAVLASLQVEHEFRGRKFDDYGSHTLDLIYVRTGGCENLFVERLPLMRAQSDRPFYLLTSGKSNSLAAAMEILSFLRQNGLRGEILHGDSDYVSRRISILLKVAEVKQKLRGTRLGVIGKPSDWLISSHVDKQAMEQLFGLQLVDIPMQELLSAIAVMPVRDVPEAAPTEAIRQALPGVSKIYKSLRAIIGQYQLKGFTLRCFDLLSAIRNTGCLALAKLNSQGYVAGCEGDVPAMVTMMIAQALTCVSGFQANPSSINVLTGEIVFAHCTIPLDMVERYELDTHFESGIGIGVRGYMKEGPVTIFKVAGNPVLRPGTCEGTFSPSLRPSPAADDGLPYFIAEGELVANQSKPDLCRTQQVIRLSDASQASYFLTRPIGNHHIIIPGHHREVLEEFFQDVLWQ